MSGPKGSKRTKRPREGRHETEQVAEPAKRTSTKKRASSASEAATTAKDAKAGDAKPPRKGKEEQSQREEKVVRQPSEKVEIVMLPVSQLRPNPWNPNRMTVEQKIELLTEVRHLGHIPKPVTVRPLGEEVYEIVDGEHNWAAAKEAGHNEVPCEILHIDDFEAMRQTFVRNRQGSRNPLLTGRLFQRMLALRGLTLEGSANSLRGFARDNNIQEATLRNYLLFVRAAEVRNHYAPETGDATITKMSVAAVRQYLNLPEDKRDEWLDRGARSDEAAALLVEAGTKPKTWTKRETTRSPESSSESSTADEPTVVNGDDDSEPTGVEGEQPPRTSVDPEPDNPTEPLSPAEQEIVESVLSSYQNGRPQVRHKILGGLGAYPDAVHFFRRMIKSGS